MADDFFKQPEEPKEEAVQEEPQKIKIGEKEYTQDEINKYVGLGQTAEQYEKQYNTKFDSAWKAYGKTTQELKDAKAKLEELQSKMQQSQNQGQELSPDQVELAKKQLTNLIGGEPITDKNFAKLYVAMREGEKLIDECTGLEKELDGADGRPKFIKDEIINYMSETGIRKPLAAWRDKYEPQLKEWETNQLSAAKPKSMFTQGAGQGEKQPQEVRPKNLDELTRQLTESLYGPQE